MYYLQPFSLFVFQHKQYHLLLCLHADFGWSIRNAAEKRQMWSQWRNVSEKLISIYHWQLFVSPYIFSCKVLGEIGKLESDLFWLGIICNLFYLPKVGSIPKEKENKEVFFFSYICNSIFLLLICVHKSLSSVFSLTVNSLWLHV